MVKHIAQWTTAAPLWADLAGIGLPEGIDGVGSTELDRTRKVFLRPAILRFTSDDYMEELTTLLESAPDRLGELRAMRETWRGPAGEVTAAEKLPRFVRPLKLRQLAAERANIKKSGGLKAWLKQPTATQDLFGPVSPALKLYQPGHMRYYLVAANLVCQATGLPDRILSTTAQERVAFVVRRLIPKDAAAAAKSGDPYPADEYAFVSLGGKRTWTAVDDKQKQLATGEERQPMFPLTYQQADGHKRRLLAGVIPVGRRETYMSAARDTDLSGGAATNENYLEPGEQLFISQVFEPWKRLIETAYAANKRYWETDLVNDDSLQKEHDTQTAKDFVRTTRDQIQSMSWLVLLDFAQLLQQYLPHVWDHVLSASATTQLGTAEGLVLTKLQGTKLGTNLMGKLGSKCKQKLVDALAAVIGEASKLESAVKVYDSSPTTGNAADYPSFLFPLADLEYADPLPPASWDTLIQTTDEPDTSKVCIDELQEAVKDALKEQAGPATVSPPQPLGNQPVMDTTEGWFVLRCVMERPECHPELSPAVVSEPSEPFQMAGFFDPDAPARPIRISLPVDTTPAGLRKFDKNAAFMLSDVLCGQVQRAKGLSFADLVLSVLPWPFHKDLSVPKTGQCTENGNTIGMICTLSIPIITICALILLIIIVNLLDLIFHWLPYFIMCFPLPNFKAKGSS